ncbi:MAG: UDP-N-acetylmuramoyl-L-alanine--D-glutamate ligase [Roseibacillus sp.]
MKLKGQNVAILGAGRSGRAAAELCLKLGAKVTVYDSNEIKGEWPDAIHLEGESTHEAAESKSFDLVVLSPGIETQGEFAQAFAKKSEGFIGEMELGFQNYNGLVVAITGTNGKTTTTELISAFLNEGGISCVPCGNHGRPLSDVALDENPPAAVALEASSFQLETIDTFRPDVAVWLNFAADHMDRYETLEEYRDAKKRIFENMNEDQVVVARTGEELESIKSRVVRFMSEWDEEEGCEFKMRNGYIYHQDEPFVCLEDTNLRGLHNAENVMAAAGAAQAAGVELDAMKKALKTFTPPAHRCELIRTLDGVEYLNDSKATNLHALESALRALTRPIVLIAGGKEKGLDYGPLSEVLQERTIGTVTFGEIGGKLGQLFSQSVKTETVETLDDAVKVAQGLASHGATVLFSPGTSSFDQFSSYIERGEAFRKLVNQLK